MNSTNKVYTVNEDKKGGKITKIIISIVAAIILLIVIAASVAVIPAGHSGVVLTMGKVSDNVLSEGMHLKIPFVQMVKNINNQIVKFETTTEASSKDLQVVSATLAVNYKVNRDMSAYVYKNIGMEYESVILAPAVNETLKAVMAQYTAEDIITKRSEVSMYIKDAIGEKISQHGLVVEDFNVVNFNFSAEFNEAIEAKQIAQQNLIKTKTEQEQAVVISETEAQKKVIQAESDAKVKKLQAEAEAEKIRIEAEAQAEANKAITESLNQGLIDYEKINKWDGKLPQVTGENVFKVID